MKRPIVNASGCLGRTCKVFFLTRTMSMTAYRSAGVTQSWMRNIDGVAANLEYLFNMMWKISLAGFGINTEVNYVCI